MSGLEITTERDDDGPLRLRVNGELDLDSSPALLAAIRSGLANARAVEVSLGEVGYIDSSGIAVLVHGYKLAHRSGIEFVILDPSHQVMSVLELSQLQHFFTIRRTGTAT